MTLTDKINAAVTVAPSAKYPDSHAVWIEGVEVVSFRVEARAQEEATIERARQALAVRLAREPVEEAAPVPTMTREQAIDALAKTGAATNGWHEMSEFGWANVREEVDCALRGDEEHPRWIGAAWGRFKSAVLAKSREPAIAAALAQTDERKGNVDAVAAAVADARRWAFEEAIEIACKHNNCSPALAADIERAIRARMAKP